jgi:ribosomal peptide maturation radical SAM protein 1
MSFRAKSEKRALEELLFFHERFPGCGVSVTDNILDVKYFRNFVPELARRQMDLELFYEVKANLRKEQVQLLSDAGIRAIQPGIESFLDSVLKLMRKGVSGMQNIQLLKWCKELGVQPHWNFLWGFPGESPAEYHEMAKLLPLLSHLPPAGGGGIVRLDRFSPNFNQAEELGFTNLSPYPSYRYIYPLEPEAVANLAYFFTYDYREPRNIREYTEDVRLRLAAWRTEYETSDLFFVDKEGRLLVWDLRPIARQPLTVLSGILRSAYLACDAACGRNKLLEVLSTEVGHRLTGEALEDLLSPLIERGLMIADSQMYLSLAIPLGKYSPSAKVLARFQEVVKGIGRSAGAETVIPIPPGVVVRQPEVVALT